MQIKKSRLLQIIREEIELLREFGVPEKGEQVLFDFGTFKIRAECIAPPRKGVVSGGTKSKKLYYFQTKVLSSLKLKKASESALKKLLDGKSVKITYKGKTFSGTVRDVKLHEVVDTWNLGLKVAIDEQGPMEEDAEYTKPKEKKWDDYFSANPKVNPSQKKDAKKEEDDEDDEDEQLYQMGQTSPFGGMHR